MGSLLANEHVLLVGVQHVTGMWVLRGMRMKAYTTNTRALYTTSIRMYSDILGSY